MMNEWVSEIIAAIEESGKDVLNAGEGVNAQMTVIIVFGKDLSLVISMVEWIVLNHINTLNRMIIAIFFHSYNAFYKQRSMSWKEIMRWNSDGW